MSCIPAETQYKPKTYINQNIIMCCKSLYVKAIAVLLVLGSCTTARKVSFDVLWPSGVEVPDHIRHLTLINNAMMAGSDSMGNYYGFKGSLYYDTTRIDTMLTMSALDGLAEAISETGRFTLSEKPVVLPLKDTSALRKPISFDVLSLIVPEETEGVVVLESISTYDQLDYDIGFDDRVYSRLMVLGIASWRMYDLTSKKIVDRWSNMDTLRFYGDGYDVDHVLAPLPDRYNALQQLAVEAGRHYARQISPTWKKVTRTYLSDNSAEMEKPVKAASSNDWETAAGEWLKLTSGKKKARAAMAAYNMAVASEVLGNLEMARYWLNKSVEIKPLPAATSYGQELSTREANLLLLKKQFGQKE